MSGRRIAVVGAGWAGLAAAVQACHQGDQVTLFEMAGQAGGRARTLPQQELLLDNGQHILIGAYQATLELMRRVGVDTAAVLDRRPLCVVYPDGRGLRLPPGPAALAFVRGAWAWRGWGWRERLGLLRLAAGWRLSGFRCDPSWTVARLCEQAPARVRAELIEPLSIAALNTPAHQASAQVLLTVLRDALFGPAGSADLLLPRAPLDVLLPAPALRWLAAHGAQLRLGHRVQQLSPAHSGAGWEVDGQSFDAVVLATPALEAARLLQALAPAWAAQASQLRFEPIITVWLHAPAAPPWPQPMMALHAGHSPADGAPAQFAFELGALGGPAGLYALVISGAADWVALGLSETGQAAQQQMAQALANQPGWACDQTSVRAVRADKRATFACTPALIRPEANPCPDLAVAGDYVQGPYPATLEGAVRSGLAAARALRQLST